MLNHTYNPHLPPKSVLAVFNDIHLGIEDSPALALCVEIAEHAGVTDILVNGDGADCGTISPHLGKKRRAQYQHGQLAQEIASGRWFIDWLRTRRSWWGEGNHDDWINDLALESGLVGTLTVQSALEIPSCVKVLPHGYQFRIGSLVIEHGDLLLGRSSGGFAPATSVLRKYPDQSTLFGHFHTISSAYRSSPDADGIFRNRCAVSLGHLSDPNKHWEYASRAPNWQQGFGIVRVWEDNRFTIDPIQVHRDRRNRPIAEYAGKTFH